MATWDITSRKDRWVTTYHHPMMEEQTCGDSAKTDYTLADIVKWLSTEADPGDLVTYGGVLLFQKLPPQDD